MSYPLIAEKDGIKMKPEIMKDHNEVLSCYEIEDEEIVSRVRESKSHNIDKILEEYIQEKNLKK